MPVGLVRAGGGLCVVGAINIPPATGATVRLTQGNTCSIGAEAVQGDPRIKGERVSRCGFIRAMGAGPAALTALRWPAGARAQAAGRTKIILILADAPGRDDPRCPGHPFMKRPNLDRSAAEGKPFTQFYVNLRTLVPHAKLKPTPEELKAYDGLKADRRQSKDCMRRRLSVWKEALPE